MLKKFILCLSLCFTTTQVMAYGENPEIMPCFSDAVISDNAPFNGTYGGFAADIQYMKITNSAECSALLTHESLQQVFKDKDIRTAFQSLGAQELYGNYTVMGIPPKESNILYKLGSSHIISNLRTGKPSDIIRFEMLQNNTFTNKRAFNIVIRMKPDNSQGNPESSTFNVSGTFITGMRNYFLFTRNDQIIFVHIYPIKYPIPKS